MSTTTIIADKDADKTRHDALTECELKIARASKDTVESIRIIGRELSKIETEELYEVLGKSDFQEYVEFSLKMDYRLARAYIRASQALEVLHKQKLQLPYNQSQVYELVKIKDPDQMVQLWTQILEFCDRENAEPTFEMVKNTVAAQRTKSQKFVPRSPKKEKSKKSSKGIDVDLGDGAAPPARTGIWSEEGEKALNRIRRMCGDDYADAVDKGQPKISERDLIAWSKEEPEMVRTLGYYIVMKRWTLRKAQAYEASAVTLETTVAKLGDYARSRGGRAYFEVNDLRLTIEVAS